MTFRLLLVCIAIILHISANAQRVIQITKHANDSININCDCDGIKMLDTISFVIKTNIVPSDSLVLNFDSEYLTNNQTITKHFTTEEYRFQIQKKLGDKKYSFVKSDYRFKPAGTHFLIFINDDTISRYNPNKIDINTRITIKLITDKPIHTLKVSHPVFFTWLHNRDYYETTRLTESGTFITYIRHMKDLRGGYIPNSKENALIIVLPQIFDESGKPLLSSSEKDRVFILTVTERK